MAIKVLNDLALQGALVLEQDNNAFPVNPAIGTMVVKDQCLYAYIKIGGLETWYPFANRTNSYIHIQSDASTTWTVNHGLGTTNIWYQVKDPAGNIMYVGKTDINVNSFQLNFTSIAVGSVLVVAPDSIDVPIVKASVIEIGGNSEIVIDNSGVLINGSYALTSANIESQINGAVAVETTARINAVLAEASARNAADLLLAGAIDTINGVDSTLQANITALNNVDTTLQNSITALNNVDTTLQNSITAITNVDTTLQNSINAEITARTNADTTLQANINTESTARTNAILAEQTARSNADVTLQANIDAEITARSNADVTLQNSINEQYTLVQASLSTTAQTSIDSWSATSYRTAKYIIQVTQGTNYQSSEILVVHDGSTTVSSGEYAIVDTNGNLVNFAADINSNNVRLFATMLSAAPATIKIKRILIAV